MGQSVLVNWCCAPSHSIMNRGLQRAAVAVVLTLLGPSTPYLHYGRLWPATPSARDKANGLTTGSIWSFPVKYEVTPVVPKRTSATRVPPNLYLQQPWPATFSARDRSNGLVKENVLSISSKYEVTPVLSKKTSATRVAPYLYLQQPWPVAPSARDRSDGLVRESIWSFPYRYERIPVVAKRMLDSRVGDPCSADEVTQETRQSRHDNCVEAAASTTTATPAPLPSHRCVLEYIFIPGVLISSLHLELLFFFDAVY